MRSEADDGFGQIAVCGTEILAPSGDDVGLVNHQEADATPAQLVHHMAVLEAFGRGDYDSGTPVQFCEKLAPDVMRLAAVQAYAINSGLAES